MSRLPCFEGLQVSDTENMAQLQVEGEAPRLPPARDVKGLLWELKPGTMREHLEEVWVQEVASQAPGCCLVGVMCSLPSLLVLLLGLLAVRFMDDEGEQARCRGQDVTNVRLVRPLTLIQEGIDARLRGLNGTERAGAVGQENPLGRIGEAWGPPGCNRGLPLLH